MESRSDFLFAKPSFLEGMARIWDFGNTLNVYNESSSLHMADAAALWMDWAAVGDDIRRAMREFDDREVEGRVEVAA